MRKFLKHLLALSCLAATVTTAAYAADTDKKLTDRIDAATAVVRELMATPDKGVPLWVAAKATCVLVVPGYKKGAFVVGGQYGQGVATCRNRHRWSAPVFVQIT
jgi:lipid-binding SYLF domain-containing protein